MKQLPKEEILKRLCELGVSDERAATALDKFFTHTKKEQDLFILVESLLGFLSGLAADHPGNPIPPKGKEVIQRAIDSVTAEMMELMK